MKELPLSWRKSKNKDKKAQLSFTDALFAENKREDIFVEELIQTFQNLKWLRYRVKYSKLTILERLTAYENLGLVLDQGAKLLYHITRKSPKHKNKGLTDFVGMIVTQHADYGLAQEITRRALLEHHDNVSGKIRGMFLAYNDILKKHKAVTTQLIQYLEISQNSISRLNHAI